MEVQLLSISKLHVTHLMAYIIRNTITQCPVTNCPFSHCPVDNTPENRCLTALPKCDKNALTPMVKFSMTDFFVHIPFFSQITQHAIDSGDLSTEE